MSFANDKVSIIMPTFNSSRFLKESVLSVIGQTYEKWELIIVDDCSTDNTCQILRELEALDTRIKVFSCSKNSGAAITRNLGIEKASGRFIAFLDSDDLWLAEKLTEQIKFMRLNSVSFSYGAYQIIDENGRLIKEFHPPPKIDYDNLLKSCPIGCLTVVYDRNVLGTTFMPNIKKRQDYALWLKLTRENDISAYCVKSILGQYRISKGSLSANKLKAACFQWKVYREIEKLSILIACRYFLSYAMSGFLKRI